MNRNLAFVPCARLRYRWTIEGASHRTVIALADFRFPYPPTTGDTPNTMTT